MEKFYFYITRKWKQNKNKTKKKEIILKRFERLNKEEKNVIQKALDDNNQTFYTTMLTAQSLKCKSFCQPVGWEDLKYCCIMEDDVFDILKNKGKNE